MPIVNLVALDAVSVAFNPGRAVGTPVSVAVVTMEWLAVLTLLRRKRALSLPRAVQMIVILLAMSFVFVYLAGGIGLALQGDTT